MATNEPVLQELAEASDRRLKSVSEPFPETWDPGNPDHPNPLVMAAFPPIMKPDNASDPLIEPVDATGKRWTVWLNSNLFKKIKKSGVKTGQPCAIQRSAEKRPKYYNAELGKEVEPWGWMVTTPLTMDTPVRGGRIMSIDEVARAYGIPEGDETRVLEGTVEPESSPAPTVAVEDDGIPF